MADVKRIARYLGQDGEIVEGVVEAAEGAPADTTDPARLTVQEVSGLDAMLRGGRRIGPARPLSEVTLLPWALGRKVVLIGRNYRAHAKEMGGEPPKSPLLFMKPSTALVGAGGFIDLPQASAEVHHEAELAVLVGARLFDASPEECERAIAGVTCLNDVTARDLQRAEVQFTRAKGFDTFCPVGPWVSAGLDWRDLRVQCRVNGDLKQDGRTSEQVFPPPQLLSFISSCMTLEPGDLVSTGTPSGVGPIRDGDVVEVEIEGIGVLRNPVRARPLRQAGAGQTLGGSR
jgi:2-keto-4-pentenoate hydratase/2-oxohepta-3-ene-1,7-dioic acid hydratase in catechol pathway